MDRFLGSVEPLGEREIGVVASTPSLARDDNILEPSGIALADYRKNPIVLWNHNPDSPIGTATAIGLAGQNLAARIEFAPLGISPLADQICGLTKAGVVNGVSIGFEILECKPLPRRGLHITKALLLDVSLVAIPADAGAGVIERSAKPVRSTAFRSLPRSSPAALRLTAARLKRDGARTAPPYSHAVDVWLRWQASLAEEEEKWGVAARQAEARRLRTPRWAN